MQTMVLEIGLFLVIKVFSAPHINEHKKKLKQVWSSRKFTERSITSLAYSYEDYHSNIDTYVHINKLKIHLVGNNSKFQNSILLWY